ncbi:MAG: helix-turn-helix domain-containing protein [Pseudonocardiaceae bacterium]
MARQPPELAEQQRLLGRYLAALRKAAGLYQTDIARAVPCHRTNVAHAEAGSQLPDAHFWETADRVVGANGGLIARYDALIQARQAHSAHLQVRRRAKAQATVQELHAASPSVDHTSLHTIEVLRRGLNEANATTGAAIDFFDGAPIGADYVESLHGTIKHLAALDGVHGGADVAPLALRSFHRAQLILREGRYEPASERDLEAVTAEIGELSGWLLFDAERHEECRQVNAEALTLARIAGDISMEWFVLSNQALASIHTGRNREALRIAHGMSQGRDLPGRVRALFDVRTARALAALGDSTSALRVFDRARSAFADGTTTRDPAWSWWFDERELAGHEGMVHAALGDHSRALPQLATAVERSEGREQFRWALYIHRANLLRALLRVGSWAEAERVAIDVVPMVGMIASARTEGLLRRTVARPEARPQVPSTLSDALDYIGNRLAGSYR